MSDFESKYYASSDDAYFLRKENEELKKDAERYRWLRENAVLRDPYDMGYGPWNWTIELETGKSGGRAPPNSTPTFDETVDAEMEKYPL